MTIEKKTSIRPEPKPVQKKTYSLKLLFLMFIPAAIGAAWLNHHWECLRPLEWEPYSEERLDDLLTSRNRVLVFAAPEWSVDTQIMRTYLDRPEVQYLIQSKKITTLIFDVSNYSENELLTGFERRARTDDQQGWIIKSCCLAYFDPKHPDKTKTLIGFHAAQTDPKAAIAQLIR